MKGGKGLMYSDFTIGFSKRLPSVARVQAAEARMPVAVAEPVDRAAVDLLRGTRSSLAHSPGFELDSS
jgi:hypothetical protein